jgi:predicted nucleotidyltransferase
MGKFREIAEPNIVLRGRVGSEVHGCSLEGTDDRDEMAVCIEPPNYVIGLENFEQWEYRDAVEREGRQDGKSPRSQPGDLDLTVYSLRKWCRLALKGNPTVLLLLYTPVLHEIGGLQGEVGYQLRQSQHLFASKRVGKAYLGYMEEQRARLVGERGSKNCNRPELLERYGFDTKYAYHMLRLGFQGLEFLQTGKLELPCKERDYLISVRTGMVPLVQIQQHVKELEAELEAWLNKTHLPDEPNYADVNRLLVDWYTWYWQERAIWS